MDQRVRFLVWQAALNPHHPYAAPMKLYLRCAETSPISQPQIKKVSKDT